MIGQMTRALRLRFFVVMYVSSCLFVFVVREYQYIWPHHFPSFSFFVLAHPAADHLLYWSPRRILRDKLTL